MSTMTNEERAVDFLKRNRGKHWCDECVAKECHFPSTWTAQMIIKVLLKGPDYQAIPGACVNGHPRRRRATRYTG